MPDWSAIVRDRVAMLGIDPADARDAIDELAAHAAQAYVEARAAGLDDAIATARALEVIGDGRTLAAELSRVRDDAAGRVWAPLRWCRDAARDMRYAARLLRAAPAFAVLAIVTIAIGVGGTASIFTVVDAVLLKPLPFASPDRLVFIGEHTNGDEAGNVGYKTFVDWRARSHSYAAMSIIRWFAPAMVVNGTTERVTGMRVSADYFRMLGVTPALGRDFDQTDDAPGHATVLILSDALWRRAFGADPHVVGRSVTLAGTPFSIVGVLPASYEPLISERFYQAAEVWAPVGYDTTLPQACRSCQHLKAVARLAPGVTVDAAQQELNTIQAQLQHEYPTEYPPVTAMSAVPLRTVLFGRQSAILDLLFGAVSCVLVIATLNVANLLLGRLATRRRELALRVALGAARSRVVRQMAIESLVLATIGGVAGTALALLVVPALVRLAPDASSRLTHASVDWRVIAFAALTSILAALVFGILPALRGSRAAMQPALREGDARSTSRGTLRRTLVVVELVVAVVLAVSASLMIRSVNRLDAINPGFDPDGVLTMAVALIGPAYPDSPQMVDAMDQTIARVKAVPGVQFAAIAGQVPLGGNFDSWGFHIQGRHTNPADDASVQRYGVTPEYFEAMRIPLRRGRYLTSADRAKSEPVMLIGEETARKLFAGVDPLGQRVRIGDASSGDWRTIVGVVGDVRHVDVSEAPPTTMYVPQAQFTDAYVTLVVRTTRDPDAVAGEIRRQVHDAAPTAPIYAVASLSDLVARSTGPRRFVMSLLVIFAGVALLLTAVGVYGVVSLAVMARRREIGIRAALGASPREIVMAVAGEDGVMIGLGLAIGAVAAIGASRFLTAASLPGLFGVSAVDPLSFVAAVGFLGLAAIAAETVPLSRALKVDPTIALRQS